MGGSDSNPSKTQKVAEYALPILSAVIGSSLLLSILNMVVSELDKPAIHIYVEQHYSLKKNASSEPEKNYYEVITRNDGGATAPDLQLSMFFFAELNENLPPRVFLNKSAIISDTTIKKNELQPSVVKVDVGNFTQNEIVVTRVWYDWNETRKFDPYYISATFEEGSSHYPVFRPTDIRSGRLPNIAIGQENASMTDQILIASTAICVIAFAAAILHKQIRSTYKQLGDSSKRRRQWKTLDLSSAIPLTVLGAIFIFYCCESVPRAFLVPTIIQIPIDVRNGPSISDVIVYEGITYSQGLLLVQAAIFVGSTTVVRTIVSYLIAKKLISLRSDRNQRTKFVYRGVTVEKGNCDSKDATRHLWFYSFIIMGLPLSSIFVLFFNESLYGSSAVYFFTISLLLDIVRMAALVFLTPLIPEKRKPFHYILGTISFLGGILNIIFGALLLKIISGSSSSITGLSDTAYFGLNSTILGKNTTEVLGGFQLLGEPTDLLVYGFAIYFFLFGCMQMGRVAIIWRLNKERKYRYRIFWIPAVMLSALVMLSWGIVMYYLTSVEHQIGYISSIISVGILTILLEVGYVIATKADFKQKKKYETKETLGSSVRSTTSTPS